MKFSNPNETLLFSHTDFILLGFPGVVTSRRLLAFPFSAVYGLILMGNVVILHRIWVEKALRSPMYNLIALLFAVNISCTTAIVPKALTGLLLGLDGIGLRDCLFQMFYIYTAVMFESSVLLMMALDRYVAICKPLRYHHIMTKSLLLKLSVVSAIQCGLWTSPIIIVASRVRFCRSNVILNFLCENMVLLNLACGDVSRLQIVGLAVRIAVTGLDITVLLISYSKILYTALHAVSRSDRRKALHTCGTHLLVVVLNYSCGLLSSMAYRMDISVDIQNLTSAVYFLFPATVHPIIYGFRVKEIKASLLKSWGMA
ncbi:olfactory receptor 52P1-like [Spea bombifrons]|uniref:olfactory receptor 52P1-like n=1 Tax=Spea bombifrons TaxID=233779 RepID=UPI002349E67E|nr:olfactory receptor 52P1-like [Spea bombifrons]